MSGCCHSGIHWPIVDDWCPYMSAGWWKLVYPLTQCLCVLSLRYGLISCPLRISTKLVQGLVVSSVSWQFFIPGFLLGTRQTLLETKDGGRTWTPRSIPSAEDEDFNYRFNSISFEGKEGWIIGKPAILLHTSDSGNSWERVPLSSRLPGNPVCYPRKSFLWHSRSHRQYSSKFVACYWFQNLFAGNGRE